MITSTKQKSCWKKLNKFLYVIQLMLFSLIYMHINILFSYYIISDSANPWTAAPQASLSFTFSGSLLKLCPLSQWCHPSISTSFSSCPQCFPELGSFPVSQLFMSGGQIIGASASILLMNSQGGLPLGLTGWISLLSKGLLRVFSSTTVWRHQFFGAQPFLLSISHIHTWLLGKP